MGKDTMPRRWRRLRPALYAVAAMIIIAAVLAGAATGVFGSLARDTLHRVGVYTDGGAPTVSPGFFDEPTPTPTETPRGAESPVLPPADPGRKPERSTLTARIDAIPDDGVGRPSYVVADPRGGDLIAAARADTPVIPASSLKILTGLAALDALGPEHRFTTRVVQPEPGRLVLVGGGDPYLAVDSSPDTYPPRASIDQLADQVAKALGRTGGEPLTLDYDASLFGGPSWNPTWPENYRDQATPTAALWVDGGRLDGTSPGRRSTTPARDAAAALAQALTSRSVAVTVGTSKPAPKGADRVASAASMPLRLIVEHMLMTSDNDAAEVLFRHVALADGEPGTIAEARAAMQRRLSDLGVWAEGTVVHDGSGLSRDNLVPVTAFVEAFTVALSDDRPDLHSLATGLPLAGTDGSLRYRYADDASRSARGEVYAKTGTLRGVHALVGLATTADDALVVIGFVVNGATNDYNARVWLDRATAAVAGCGC